MRRRDVFVGLIGAAISLISGSAVAAEAPKLAPTRVGQTIIFRNLKFTAIKKNGKIIWGKGIPIPVKSATPTPAASPATSPSAQAAPSAKGIKVASSADLSVGGSKVVTATRANGSRVSIALTRDNSGIRAFSAECPHAGFIVKPQGSEEFICNAHNSLFSAKNGEVLRGPASSGLGSYPVTESGGEIFVTI